jgi:flagellar biosynthesis/type III secretory pathway chaperone
MEKLKEILKVDLNLIQALVQVISEVHHIKAILKKRKNGSNLNRIIQIMVASQRILG